MQGSTNSTSVYTKNTNVTFTENGTYIPSEEYTGFGVVTVDTPTVEDIVMQDPYLVLPRKMDFTIPETDQYDYFTSPFDDGEGNVYVNTKGDPFIGLGTLKVKRVGSWIDSEINTDNIKAGHSILGVLGHVIEVNNQANKTARSNSTSTQYIRPDSGYTGLSQVTVEPVSVQPYKDFTINQPVHYTTDQHYTVYKDSDKIGLNEVRITLKPPPACPTYITTDLSLNPTTSEQVEKASDHNVDGFGKVTVAPVTSSIDENIKSENIAPGVIILGVEGSYKPKHLQNKVVEPNIIQDQVVKADNEYEALGEVTVKKVTAAIDSDIQSGNIREGVDILGVTGTYHGPDYNIETVTGITPLTTAQTIVPSTGYDYLDSVTINGVTAAIDQNIQSGNIKEGVTILGVEGTFATQTVKTQEQKTVTPTTSEQHVRADTGYDAIVELIVRAVTAGIDPNIVAENIKKNITILGVRGTLDATQKWFDFQDQNGFTVLTSDTFGNAQFAPYLITDLTDYVVTSALPDTSSQPIENLGAAIFSTVFGYNSLTVTDPILYQSYIYFQGGYYYTDYDSYISIKNQISYIYPLINNDNINGCLLNCEDTGFEKTYNIYVITGINESKPVLVDGTISTSMLPEGYDSFRYVGTITVPDHNVFKPVEALTQNVSSNIARVPYNVPILSANGILGGNYFAVQASSHIDNRDAWRAFDGTNNDGEIDCWHSSSGSPQWIEWYFPEDTYIDSILIKNRQSPYSSYTPTVFQIQISADGNNWDTIYSGTNSIVATNAAWSIDLSNIQNRVSKYWRLYVTGSYENDYVVIGEIVLDAFQTQEISRTKWEQPILTSANSYGTVTWGDLETGSDEAWKVFTDSVILDLTDFNYTEENELATITAYIGSETEITLPKPVDVLANVIPDTEGSFIKWVMPNNIKLVFSANYSSVFWQHAADTNIMSGTPLQIFADANKTIPLTNTFTDPGISGESIVVPIIKDYITDTIYIYIGTHENAGGISRIHFNNVYLNSIAYSSTTQSWLLDNSIKPAVTGTILYDDNAEITTIENDITFTTLQTGTLPIRVNVSACDTNKGEPNILSEKNVLTADITAKGGLSINNGSVSGFSLTAYAQTERILQGSNIEITMRAYCSYSDSYAQYLISDTTGSGFGLANGSGRYFRITNIQTVTNGSSGAFTNGTWQWIKFVQTGTTSTLYAFQDSGTYTSVDSLPPVSDSVWVSKVSLSQRIFVGSKFIIGSRQNGDQNYQGYWRNSIDFSNLKVSVDGIAWKPYSTITHYISSHNIVPLKNNLLFVNMDDATTYYESAVRVFGYEDNGSAITINAYAVYDNLTATKTYVFAPNATIPFETPNYPNRFINLGLAGTVDIPEHIAYRFDLSTHTWVRKA